VKDVWVYFEAKKREVEQFGLTLEDGFLFAAEDRSNDQRGRVWGRIGVTERTFLSVSERVEVRGAAIHRTDYAYYLIIDGTDIWGYERDPTHDLAVHRHDRDHNRYPCDPISFKDALTKAWETASDEDSWEPPQ
jgi:hypothetical protein